MRDEYQLILGLASLLVVMVVSLTYISARHYEKMAEMGYQETALTGTSNTIYQKVK